ncbi:GNAT family N-acetyltransferase; N-acetyltransferase [Celerinatantimonas sp. YJH-8]|uniref:GNAT family N-acetyltransferase n=1 Tax=Celerinatantimonas sp. YJH-8 TaxID=3228714 RepID=UPI0038CA5447
MLNQTLIARRLSHGRIELRATSEQFAPLIHEAVCRDGARLTYYLPWITNLYSLSEVIHSQREAASQFEHFHDELRYILFPQDSSQFLGTISLIKGENVPFSLGYWLSHDALGCGYITEAVNLLSEYAHHLLSIDQIQIRVAASNGPSRRVAQRCGYQILDGFCGWDILGDGREERLLAYEKKW